MNKKNIKIFPVLDGLQVSSDDFALAKKIDPIKKVGFIIPPYFDGSDYISEEKTAVLPAFTIPYGILSMVTYLNANLSRDIKFEILDLNIVLKEILAKGSTNYQEILNLATEDFCLKNNCDFIGISALFNSSYNYLSEIANIAKKVNINCIVGAGGGLPSAAFQRILEKCKNIDAVCKGEGELPLLRLLESQNPLFTLQSDQSWATRESLKKEHLPKHSFIDNLDLIPPLDYSLVNLKDYNSRGIDKAFAKNLKKQEMAIHTSRGCPFKCVFCSNPSLHGYDVRTMTIDRVVKDVTRMRDEFGMTVLMIEDDHFFHDKKRAKNILRELGKLGIRCEFPNGVAVYAIDQEVADLFAIAGVSAVALAIESGSDFVLNKLMKKPLKTKAIVPAITALRNANVRAHAFMVVGIPGEKDEHREETRKMLVNSGIDWVHIYCAIPIFGSKLFEICKENGFIDLDENSDTYVVTKSVINAPGIDPKKIEQFVYNLQLEVNFIENYNLKQSRFDLALPYFENVVEKYPNHAFGQFFISKCYRGLNNPTLASKHEFLAKEIFKKDAFWRDLPISQNSEIKNFISGI